MLFVDRTLMQCTCPKIKEFSITGNAWGWGSKCSFPVDSIVDKWIDFLFGKEVEVLNLGLAWLDHAIPARFCQSSSLVRLEIDEMGKICWDHGGDEFASIVSLEDDGRRYWYRKTFDVCWSKLKILSLKCVHVEDEFMVDVLVGCPMLETLVLDRVGGLRTLNINSPILSELKLLNGSCGWPSGRIPDIEVTAPQIKKLEVSGKFDSLDCNLVCVSSLKSANLTLTYEDLSHVEGYDDDGNYGFVSSDMIYKLLEPVCDVDDLDIGAYLLQAISISHLTSSHCLIFECKYIAIHSPISMHEVPGIVCLLESSPNLVTLDIMVMPWQCRLFNNKDYMSYGYPQYIERLFTSFNGVDYLGEQKQKLLCLKNVQIDCREKLYSEDEGQTSDNKCLELEIAAYIIKHAPFLEKLVLLFSKSNCFYGGALYFSILSLKRKVGEKAARWELKKMVTTYEFIFSPGFAAED